MKTISFYDALLRFNERILHEGIIEEDNNYSFEELLNQTLKEIKVGQTVTGTVIEITPKNEVFIDIGYKADGIIPANGYILNAGETVQEKFKGKKWSSILFFKNGY